MNANALSPLALGHRCVCVTGRLAFVDCRLARSTSLMLMLIVSSPGMAAIMDAKAIAVDAEAIVTEPGALSEPPLPRVMSTNLCADMLLLGLADASQVVSLSYQSKDPQRSSQAEAASQFASNQATAEEVIAELPDIVLASRRWQAQHQSRLFERFGINVIKVPYPNDWLGIFESLQQIGEAIGRSDRAAELIADTRRRLQQIESVSVPVSALYLRGNGGTAAAGTFIDALFQSLTVTNQASQYGVTGWGRVSLESIVLDPPDAFMLSRTEHDASIARSGVVRHPLLRQLLVSKPVLSLSSLDTGCSDWRQVETVEKLAAELNAQFFVPATRQLP